MTLEMWQTTNLDYAVAESLFGWRWLAHEGIPVRGTPGYPQKTTVRRFYPPDKELGQRWMDYFEENGGARPANGDEPLDYAYCSSSPPHYVPHFSGHESDIRDMEKELKRRGLFAKYKAELGRGKTCKARCIAALKVCQSATE